MRIIHSLKNFIYSANVLLLVLALVLAIIAVCNCAQPTTELFPNFYNLWSIDVKNLQDYDFKTTNSCIKCPRIYIPICGSDNNTYINECQMACMNVLRKRDPQVSMTRTGHCRVFPEQAT